MARGAIHVVERCVVVRNQAHDPGHLVRVHVQETGVGIEGGAAPFAAAVEAGKHDRASLARRREEPGVELPEPGQHRRMRLRRPRRQHVFGEMLPREWRWFYRVGLRIGELLAVNCR